MCTCCTRRCYINRLGKSLIEDYEVKLDDARNNWCYKALAKVDGLDEENKNQFSDDAKPMKSALAF